MSAACMGITDGVRAGARYARRGCPESVIRPRFRRPALAVQGV